MRLLLPLALLPLACSTPTVELPPPSPTAEVFAPQPGKPMLVAGDTRLQAGAYVLPPLGSDGSLGVLQLNRVQNLTVDLSGVTLRGTPPGTPIDQGLGFGIVVRGCKNVTLRGGNLGGYLGCVVVEDSEDVVLEDMQFDGWFGQRLRSTSTVEDPADWLRPHENDHGEWLSQYGAAISITDSRDVSVRRCRARHGQNGLCLTRVEGAQIYDNDFSFLSGWGIALYRSSNNVISRNICDYCVRGFSHGNYWRGQDSAGILLFEGCSDNTIAFNSATHSGDGVFLFAGNDLVEGRAVRQGRGDPGGSDRNVFWGNDLRFSVANSFEATFSANNLVARNDLSGSHQHGIWGGYSSRMVIVDNVIEDTLGGGVTIEHGQECGLVRNRIASNERGVEFYWDEDPQFVEGPYGEQRDTDSRGHWLIENRFGDNDRDLVLRETSELYFLDNRYAEQQPTLDMDRVSVASDPQATRDTVRGWMAGRDGSSPSGILAGVEIAPSSGGLPEWLTEALAREAPDVPGEQTTRAEERGVHKGGLETIVLGEWGPWDFRSGDPRPEVRQMGGVLAGTAWEAAWFSWDPTSHDPRSDPDAWRALVTSPSHRATVMAWTDPWGGSDETRLEVGAQHFGLMASARVQIPRNGTYRLSCVSDDGVRIRVNGDVVIEDWTWHAPKTDEVQLPLKRGAHDFSLEYFQIDGAFALVLELTEL